MYQIKILYSFRIIILLSFLVFSNITDANTVNKKWQINSDHSEILFKIDYLLVSSVTGFFKSFEGEIDFDETNTIPKTIVFKINSQSITTNNNIRDGHLKSKEFLWTEKYPAIKFNSQKIEQINKNQFQVLGLLQFRDQVKSIQLNLNLSDTIKDSWNYENKFVNFAINLNLKSLDIKWNKAVANNNFLIGDQVRVEGKLQLQQNLTPGHKHKLPNTEFINLKDKLRLGEITKEEYYKQLYLSQIVEIPIDEIPKAQAVNPVVVSTPEVKVVDPRSDILWQISFFFVAIFGFCSSFLIPMFVKVMIFPKYKEKIQTNGLVDSLFDIPFLVLGFLYFVALYHVGY